MASFSTFSDPLLISTQDTSLWAGNFGTLSWSPSGFTITNPINYTGYGGDTSAFAYDLTGAACYCFVANVGNQSLASCESIPMQLNNLASTNKLFWYVSGGTVAAYKVVSSTQTQITSTTYNASTMKWFSIAEGAGRKSGTGVSGTTYFEYSADGVTWTLFTSLANPFAVTALGVSPSLGTYANEASATTMKINSFNTPPSGSPPATNSGFFAFM